MGGVVQSVTMLTRTYHIESAGRFTAARRLDKPTVATLETVDGFTYTLNIGKTSDENYHLTMKVSANLLKAREVGKDEKPEDKMKLDKEFEKLLVYGAHFAEDSFLRRGAPSDSLAGSRHREIFS